MQIVSPSAPLPRLVLAGQVHTMQIVSPWAKGYGQPPYGGVLSRTKTLSPQGPGDVHRISCGFISVQVHAAVSMSGCEPMSETKHVYAAVPAEGRTGQ